MKIYNLKFVKIGRICSLISKYIINHNFINKKVSIVLINSSFVIYNLNSFFFKHTGYPGGLKKIKNVLFVSKKGINNFIKRTLLGMLPKKNSYRNIVNNIIFK